MKPTRILTLVVVAAATALVAYLAVRIAVGAGLAMPVSEANLLATLPSIGVVNIGLAVPILRYKRATARFSAGTEKTRPKRLNPFYAVRVVLVSKSAAIAGALFLGWHLGVLANQISTQVVSESIANTVVGLIGSLIMLVAGVVSERACRLPEDPSSTAAEAA